MIINSLCPLKVCFLQCREGLSLICIKYSWIDKIWLNQIIKTFERLFLVSGLYFLKGGGGETGLMTSVLLSSNPHSLHIYLMEK